MPLKKFNFISEKNIGKEINMDFSYRVTVTKQNTISFNRETISVYDLEGKRIRLFADTEKKCIGWVVVDGKTSLPELNDARVIHSSGANKVANIGVTKLLKIMGIQLGVLRPGIPVQKYKDGNLGDEIYYIELKNNEPEKSREE